MYIKCLVRPKKCRNKPGRPPLVSPLSIIRHIKSIAPPSFTIRDNVLTTDTDFLTGLTCPLCFVLVERPVELTECGTLLCAECCCQRLRVSGSLSCPCCYSEHLADYDTIRPASHLTLRVLGSMEVTCTSCSSTVQLKDHKDHADCGCKVHCKKTVSVREVLDKPRDTPLSALEQKLQSSLVKRSLATNTSPTLQVKTRGQVSLTWKGSESE